MRALLLSAWLVITMLVSPAHAAENKPENAWHFCKTDADCVLAESVCGPIAVSRSYQSIAVEYHKQHDSKSDCKSGLLYAKPNAVACQFESCTAVYN